VGIIAALRAGQIQVAPFKKGPDYIDAGWLALAAGRPCYNLDTFLIDRDTIRQSYTDHTRTTTLPLSKATAALYDCIDTKGKPAPPNWPSCWAFR
jgi:cobyrinic acid a,c-diamide synthase